MTSDFQRRMTSDFQKCKDLKWDKLHLVNFPVVVEEKLDGESLILAKGVAYGRRTSTVTGQVENKWNDMPPWLRAKAQDFEVHGELYVKGGTSTDVKSALKQGREEGWDAPLAARLGFAAYRLPGGPATAFFDVRALLQANDFAVPELLQREGGGIWHDARDIDKDRLFNEARSRGLEGWVLKERDGVWWKVKLEDTVDCIVVGTKDGNGKYMGLVGALVCAVVTDDACSDCGQPHQLRSSLCASCYGTGYRLEEIASCSGMTDEEREDITEMHDQAGALLGQVVEIKYSLVAAKGRLRHPRFMRFREDKTREECRL